MANPNATPCATGFSTGGSEAPTVFGGAEGHLGCAQRPEAAHRVTAQGLLLPDQGPPQGDDWGERAPLGGDGLAGRAHEWAQGKGMKIKGYPKEHKERCFRGEVSPHGAEGVVTNARAQRWREATQSVGGLRGTIEPWTRGGKPVTGREGCPCRQAGIQGHHSGCAFLVRVRLKELATPMGRRSINSNRGGWMITSLSNSRIRLSKWFLPKSYSI